MSSVKKFQQTIICTGARKKSTTRLSKEREGEWIFFTIRDWVRVFRIEITIKVTYVKQTHTESDLFCILFCESNYMVCHWLNAFTVFAEKLTLASPVTREWEWNQMSDKRHDDYLLLFIICTFSLVSGFIFFPWNSIVSHPKDVVAVGKRAIRETFDFWVSYYLIICHVRYFPINWIPTNWNFSAKPFVLISNSIFLTSWRIFPFFMHRTWYIRFLICTTRRLLTCVT